MNINNLPVYVNHNGRIVVTSLDVARIFKVSHEDLVEPIEEGLVKLVQDRFPHQIDVVDSDGNPVKTWEMTRLGFEWVWDWWLARGGRRRCDRKEARQELEKAFAQAALDLTTPQKKENDHGNS